MTKNENTNKASYFVSLSFKDGIFRIVLEEVAGAGRAVTFNYVAMFVFFKEIDFYESIAKYKKDPVADFGNANISQIVEGSMLQNMAASSVVEQDPLFFAVWTPDECFEVAAFEAPQISLAGPIIR